MYQILSKRALNEQVTMMEIEAPLIAKKARPGQFIIFRVDEFGERVPLTVAATDPERGAVTIIFQAVGLATKKLQQLEAGDAILDFVGPLGRPSDLDGARRAVVIGGGVGNAIAYPSARYCTAYASRRHRRLPCATCHTQAARAASRYITTMMAHGAASHRQAARSLETKRSRSPSARCRDICARLTREYHLRTLVCSTPSW